MGTTDNAEARSRITAFLQALQELGWTEGRTVQINLRWGGNSPESITAQARELTQLKPDVIFAGPTNALIPLQKETRTIPIVFVTVSDPLEQGFVQSLARPNGNITGFSNLEYSLIGKWLQLLKEAAPGLTQVGLMISTMNASSPKWYQMFKAVAATLQNQVLMLANRLRCRFDQQRIFGELANHSASFEPCPHRLSSPQQAKPRLGSDGSGLTGRECESTAEWITQFVRHRRK